jgi:hypothetical protein
MLADKSTPSEVVIACTPDNVPVEKRERWFEVGKEVYAMVQEVRELRDGYACLLPGDSATLIKAAEYVSLDRMCCQFVRWSLVIEPNGGPLWLHLTGPEGTKEYTRTTFETTPLLQESVARAAGFSTSGRMPWVHPSNPAMILD